MSEVFAELDPPYATIVADPPWHYDERVISYGAGRALPSQPMPYSTMTVEEIAALPVLEIAAADAHLYLWTTNRYLWASREICLGWGFEPVQVLTWCKPPSGLTPGGLFASSTEFIVYARRYHGGGARLVERAGRKIREARQQAGLSAGELHRSVRGGEPTGIVTRWENDDSVPNPRDWERLQQVLPSLADVERDDLLPKRSHEPSRVDRSWWEWPRYGHSVKPPGFIDIVEQVSPGPYVELFARQPRLGWDSWGYGYEQNRKGAA